jgi:hypothetical protein
LSLHKREMSIPSARKPNAPEIEALAKRRLADEYDAAQERGDAVGPHDGYKKMKRVTNSDALATAADYGLTRQEIHEARQIRDAEKRKRGFEPLQGGIVGIPYREIGTSSPSPSVVRSR